MNLTALLFVQETFSIDAFGAWEILHRYPPAHSYRVQQGNGGIDEAYRWLLSRAGKQNERSQRTEADGILGCR